MMSALTRYVLESSFVRRVTGAVVRNLVDAENAVHFSTWPYPTTPRDAPIELSICLLAGPHRVLLVRTVMALLDDLPAAVEILIAECDGPARHAKRVLSDYQGVRYVGVSDATHRATGQHLNELVDAAHGGHVLLLAPGTVATRHVVTRALELARQTDTVGASFTGPVVDHAGRITEAGSIRHVETRHAGKNLRSDVAVQHEYMHASRGAARAAVLVDRDVYGSMGGCDPRSAEAMIEGLCARLLRAGTELRFDPRLAVLDLEVRHETRRARQQRLIELRRLEAEHPDSQSSGPPDASFAAHGSEATPSFRILLIENRVPHPDLGEGFPRSYRLVRALDDAGHRVTIYPLIEPAESVPSIYRDLPRHIPVLRGFGCDGLGRVLTEQAGCFDLIIVARPFNMSIFRDAVDASGMADALPPIVYDAEAINAVREIARNLLEGNPVPKERADALIDQEVALAAGCKVVVAVSDRERVEFESRGVPRVLTLGHALEAQATPTPFGDRQDFLFVGALLNRQTPNFDGLTWFIQEVWPVVLDRLGPARPRLLVIGKTGERVREALACDTVDVLGKVDDLESFYARARVFVAPTRFSAGIPLKVLEAAAYGVPIVAMSQAARQLGWADGVELLTGDTAEAFATMCVRLYRDEELWRTVRTNALQSVASQASLPAFEAMVEKIVRLATVDSHAS